jgi:Uma2 family endonuclease
MPERVTLDRYLQGRETMRPRELAYGVLREPPAPSFHHQVIVGRLHVRLERHVRRLGAGRVALSPVDVVLDIANALVVQPDLVFISQARLAICTEQIWGAPDLVIEVLSSGTRRHDSTVKLGWYRRYGVRECWLVDPVTCEITVFELEGETQRSCSFSGAARVRSAVLPRLSVRAADVFTD